VARPLSNRPFAEELAALLEERGLSQRALADDVGVAQSHISRLLRGADYRNTPSRELLRKIALVLDLPEDYFAEYRAASVIEAVRTNPGFRERAYRLLRTSAKS
jgi:transcriptional regulator with XRE-family HTH domain